MQSPCTLGKPINLVRLAGHHVTWTTPNKAAEPEVGRGGGVVWCSVVLKCSVSGVL